MFDEDFLREIDAVLPRTGYGDRSKFIRAAVYKDMQQMGMAVPIELMTSPGRKGKGGKPTHKTKIKVSGKKNIGQQNNYGGGKGDE